MSNAWRHSICDSCWRFQNPGRDPVRLKGEYVAWERCCFCGADHRSGIYVRKNSADMECNGEHAAA